MNDTRELPVRQEMSMLGLAVISLCYIHLGREEKGTSIMFSLLFFFKGSLDLQ